MDIDARIKRRQHRTDEPRLVEDYESLAPVSHVSEPSDRGPVFERLLDHLDPVFDGQLPPNAYVYGPFGSGKSAIVTALFAHLDRLSTENSSVIHTSTRASTPVSPAFAYLDLRELASEFALYGGLLDAVVDDSVPDHGVSTEELRERLRDVLGGSRAGIVVAVDHVYESDDIGAAELLDVFAGLPSNLSWLAVGRNRPEEVALTEHTANTIRVERYRRETLVDVLMTRASLGLTQQALDHELARRIADWADGNAHHALAALFVATDRATTANRTHLTESDVASAFEEFPGSSVSLGRVLALPANKQFVLRKLIDLDADECASVAATTEAISADPSVDLSRGTVKRYLYEMAETGVVERVESESATGKGRPPSRVELRFPPTAFRRLYDLNR
ncbi:Cdc6/Cdc18 family protein [Halorussus amylolyticus]|uniref:Cdc6/Cdc18 family protein n=1 Tax=Halorussus amylolyticus TaxID=1126242 RepID=UPI001050FA61|nr:AAA family ATPase [Halorussus amylolyticus]